MLNELRDLSKSIQKTGIEPPDWHDKFGELPKNALSYWAYLDNQGNIVEIVPVSSSDIARVRKWEDANGVSFPAFNLPPLLEPNDKAAKLAVKELKKIIARNEEISNNDLARLKEASSLAWSEQSLKRIDKCLRGAAADVEKRIGNANAKFSAITELFKRAALVSAENLHGILVDLLHEDILSRYGDLLKQKPQSEEEKQAMKEKKKRINKMIDSLFFSADKSLTDEKTVPKTMQVILELSDRGQFDYPANHPLVQEWMNSMFLASSIKSANSELDAFGENASGKDEKYPKVRLPVLGNVKLRSMFEAIPCQTRYGMIDYNSFPAGDITRKRMKSALEWLSANERKGKTWCDLSRRMDRPMLLFAYPAQIPESLPDLAGMIGDTEDEESEMQQEKFSALAEKVTLALRGRTKETVDAEVRIFVLAKMDKARTKVLASNRYSAEHVIRSAQLWVEGNHNVPNIKVRSFGKNKGDKAFWSEMMIPFPTEVIWCLNTVWTRQGTHAEGAHGFSVNDALCLLLGTGFEPKQVAVRALGTALRNSSSLFLAIGQANAQGFVLNVDRKYAKQMKLLPSLLGLLLYKLGHRKGGIMTTPAFLVGKLLNLADSLHLEYCKGVRKGSVPPQLVGNALMATALETPEKALSMLSQRVLPYQAWARTLTGGDEVRLAKFFLKHIGEVTAQLKNIPLPQRSSDTDKAQMLLGYLARLESENN